MNIYPAMKFKFGNWEAYQIVMPVEELNRNIVFARDNTKGDTLGEARQREIDESRAKGQIARYLIKPDNERFFNSLVIAVEGGSPSWEPAPIDTADDHIVFDENFKETYGAIKFDGNQEYYALDGQHRMAGIKYVLEDEDFADVVPRGFRKDQVSLILVIQPESNSKEEFRLRYRRLFGHLNRYAKPTGKVSNIIMDEDDVFAILTRRLVREHELFSARLYPELGEFIDRVKTNQQSGGKNINSGEPFITTLGHLYDMNMILLTSPNRKEGTGTYKKSNKKDPTKTSEIEFSTWVDGEQKNIKWGDKLFKSNFLTMRPEDEAIESLYQELNIYWNVIAELIPELLENPENSRDNTYDSFIEGKSEERRNHSFLRPVVQLPIATLLRSLLDRAGVDDTTYTERKVKNAWKPIGNIDWDLSAPPFRNLLFIEENETWKMRSSDRSQAMKLTAKLLRYITGTFYLDDEEDLQDFKDEVNVYISPPMAIDGDDYKKWWKAVEKQKKNATS